MAEDGESTKRNTNKRKRRVPRLYDATNGAGGGWQGGGRPKGSKDKKPRKKLVEFTPALQWKFLDTLANNGSIKASAAHVDLSAAAVHKLMRTNDHFNDLVETALAKYLTKLEDELSKRIFEGNETLEYDGEGNLVRRIVKQDNDLLKLALKASDKEKYSDKAPDTSITIDANSAIGKLAEFLKLDKPVENPAKDIDGEFRKVDPD